jgi:hypothetical protein
VHAAHARLGAGQRTIKGWHTAVHQLIKFRGFGNQLKNLAGGGYKIANYSLKAVNGTQYKLQ